MPAFPNTPAGFGGFPGLRAMDLFRDLAAGAIVAVVLAPQSMAYALLAGLPPINGLYAATIPLIVYPFLGSSRQLAVGPVAMVSLLVQVACSKVASPGTPAYHAAALQLSLLVGFILVLLALFRAGFLVNFLSRAAIGGFTSAAAIVIALSQLKHLLGISAGGGESAFQLLREIVPNLPELHPLTTVIGLAAIALLVVVQRLFPRIPAPLVAVVAGTLLVALFRLDLSGVKTVGDLPQGLPPLSLPTWDPGLYRALLPAAATIAIVGYLESFAIADLIAAREKYRIDPNRELTGLGCANLAAALFSGYPVTGGFSRTAVNHRAGARSGVASLITAAFILLILLWFTRLFHYLPKAVLAAIVVVAVAGLLEVAEARHLFRIKKSDGFTFVLTFLVTLGFGVEAGIVSGVAFSLLVFIWRSAHPHIAELGWLPDEKVFRNLSRYPAAQTFPGLLLVRVDASLYFANMGFVADWLRACLARREDPKSIVLDMTGVNDMDAVALTALESEIEVFAQRGISIFCAGMKGPVRDLTDKAGWPERYGRNMSFLTLRDAVAEFCPEFAENPGERRKQDLSNKGTCT